MIILDIDQEQAVNTNNRYTLLLAGPGTGKTRVLTARILKILTNFSDISPSNILALTFSVKAAQEIRKRLSAILPIEIIKQIWIGTFHSIANRILRLYDKNNATNFTILSEKDSMAILRDVLKTHYKSTRVQYEAMKYDSSIIFDSIQKLKNQLKTPEHLERSSISEIDNIPKNLLYTIYSKYQQKLQITNSLDFSDLILILCNLLRQNKTLCYQYQSQFKYILVDEYQDLNFAQYALLRLLLQTQQNNLYCVGDDDQTIYEWRGAAVENILNFAKDFPLGRILKLQNNYRSTNAIVEAANHIIARNKKRHSKSLFSIKKEDSKFAIHLFSSDLHESYSIASMIVEIMKKSQEDQGLNQCNDQDINNNINTKDFTHPAIAILVRNNHQTAVLEEGLKSYGLNYEILGSSKLQDTEEIQNIISYLEVALDNDNNLAIQRVMQSEGITENLDHLYNIGKIQNLSLFQAITYILNNIKNPNDIIIKSTLSKKLVRLINNINTWKDIISSEQNLQESPIYKRITAVINNTKLISSITNGKLLQFEEIILPESQYLLTKSEQIKCQNIMTFIESLRAIKTNEELVKRLKSLYNNSNAPQIDTKNTATTHFKNNILISTIHMVKGMEFDTVFLPGWEEGIFPNIKQKNILHTLSCGKIENDDEEHSKLEEERRLAYVGITRAENILNISYTARRYLYGSYIENQPSRFIDDIPTNHYKLIKHYC